MPRENEARVVYIIDGDTIKVSLNGKKDTLRFIGIDTPEARYSDKAKRDAKRSGKDIKAIYELGKRSENFLKSIISPGDKVFLEYDVEKREKRGSRLLAYVYLESGEMLNEELVRKGYAIPYTFPPNVRYVERFKTAAEYARDKGLGLWNE